jgi:hypothetical protein
VQTARGVGPPLKPPFRALFMPVSREGAHGARERVATGTGAEYLRFPSIGLAVWVQRSVLSEIPVRPRSMRRQPLSTPLRHSSEE